MPSARLTILTENTTHRPGLLAEHGFSVWVECAAGAFLFDTGQTTVFSANAAQMGIALSQARAIILSHGHYDHTGGLATACELAPQASIHAHPDILAHKYSHPPNAPARYIGLPVAARQALNQHARRVVWTADFTELADGLWVSGAIPRRHDFEDVGGPFYLDAQGTTPDPLMDDMALGVRTREGLVLLLGCAHAGVINTLAHFRCHLGDLPVCAVLGGMHLLQASPARMTATLNALAEHQVKRIGAAHCTGLPATVALWNRFPGQCLACTAGTQIEFE